MHSMSVFIYFRLVVFFSLLFRSLCQIGCWSFGFLFFASFIYICMYGNESATNDKYIHMNNHTVIIIMTVQIQLIQMKPNHISRSPVSDHTMWGVRVQQIQYLFAVVVVVVVVFSFFFQFWSPRLKWQIEMIKCHRYVRVDLFIWSCIIYSLSSYCSLSFPFRSVFKRMKLHPKRHKKTKNEKTTRKSERWKEK